MKKILHITTHFFPFVGGLENLVLDLAREQAKKYRVSVLTLKYDKSLPKTEIIDGVEVYRHEGFEILKGQYSLPMPGFSKQIKTIDPDVIFTHTRFFMTSLLGQKQKGNRKKIHVEHGQNFVKSKNRFIEISAFIFDKIWGKSVIKKSDEVVVLSEEGARFVQKVFGRTDNISIIPNGVRVPSEENIKAIRRRNRVIFFGRIIPEKGIEEIITVAEHCPDWEFFVYGDFNHGHIYPKDGKNIKFFGSVPHRDIFEKIQDSDLVLLPSWSEGNSLSVLEACANARAVLATCVGQNEKILSPDFLVPIKNPKKIVEKLNALKNRWDILEHEGKRNYESVKKHYRFETMIKRYDRIIER